MCVVYREKKNEKDINALKCVCKTNVRYDRECVNANSSEDFFRSETRKHDKHNNTT